MENGGGSDPGVGLEPSAVEEADFATVRRGYEPGPVRARLRDAAEEIRRLNALVGSLSNRIAELEATPVEVLERRRVAEALGDEATRILQSASDAAQERIESAEQEHARIVGESRATASAAIEEGREQGRNMVLEARNVRERILADLAAKRQEYQIEVEHLREIRERLLEALGIFRQGLDGWIEDLVQAGPRAAAAAERAGLRVAALPEPTVAQIEAEIGTARLAGMPLDGGPATEAGAPDEAPALDDAAPEDGGDVEPQRLQDTDEPEAVGEPVDIAGLTFAPSPQSPGAPARLYDIEAEAEFDAGGASPAVEVETGSDADAPPASDAEAIFARLRSITAHPVGASPGPAPTEPGPAGGEVSPQPAGAAGEPAGFADEFDEEFADEPAEFADEFDDEFADEHEAAGEPVDPDDLVGAARAVAVGGMARRLKRVVVDEQGNLLDGIRRNGVRAVRSAIAGDTKAYTRAARIPMQDFASDIDVSIDDIDLAAAGDAIVSVLVEPVRTRLSELVEETDDAEELSSVVRSLYRESRSRRADSAAEAAFSAGWLEPVS